MTTVTSRRRPASRTPDSHSFPTRPYDLVKEFSIALVIVLALSLALAAVFSSPDRPAVSLADWAHQAPDDVIATATAELAGTSTSAGYGGPYNSESSGQKLGPLALQKWAGVQIPVDSAKDLVLDPLSTVSGEPRLTAALNTWSTATGDQQTAWASAYADALAATPDGSPAAVKTGAYGPVPVISADFLTLAGSGGLQSQLAGTSSFYNSDQTRAMLLLADGAYLEDQARAENLGGDQWGMMNESGNYPGQPWMWLYTFWYQIKPFSTSDNADALVWGLMMLLTIVFIFLPFVPGLRSLPKHLGVHKLIWRK
jgi:hypothetical protein